MLKITSQITSFALGGQKRRPLIRPASHLPSTSIMVSFGRGSLKKQHRSIGQKETLFEFFRSHTDISVPTSVFLVVYCSLCGVYYYKLSCPPLPAACCCSASTNPEPLLPNDFRRISNLSRFSKMENWRKGCCRAAHRCPGAATKYSVPAPSSEFHILQRQVECSVLVVLHLSTDLQVLFDRLDYYY